MGDDAPGKALELVGIDAAVIQHVGMAHSAAEDFQPVLALAEPYAVLVAAALDFDFERGLGEREIRRPESHLDVIALEERPAEFPDDQLAGPGERLPSEHKAPHLVQHRRLSR